MEGERVRFTCMAGLQGALGVGRSWSPRVALLTNRTPGSEFSWPNFFEPTLPDNRDAKSTC